MTRIAELQDRLRRLAKRREGEGIYTDAAICEEAAEALSRTGAVKVKALDEDDYEEIINAAGIALRNASHGIRGQVITVYDSLGWWVMKETEHRILSALEPAALEGQQPVAHVIRKGFSSGVLGWTGYGQKADLPDGTMLYTRPAEQAVTDEMVEAAAIAISGGRKDLWDGFDLFKRASFRTRAMHALKAAMEAGRHD